jgi:hypothetical protein
MPTPTLQRDQARKAILDEDDDDDSWMTSPSKLPKLSLPAFATGSLVLQQLRLKFILSSYYFLSKASLVLPFLYFNSDIRYL